MRVISLVLLVCAAAGCDRNKEPVRPTEALSEQERDALVEEQVTDDEEPPIDTTTRIDGPLTETELSAAVSDHTSPVRECFDAALARGQAQNLTGPIVVEFEVKADGTVADATVAESGFDDAEAGRCIVTSVEGWTFPKSKRGKGSRVRYAFFLRSY